LNRAEFDEDCLLNNTDEVEHQLLCIVAALNRYRADAWDHIADLHERGSRGVRPDPDGVADLHHCRVRIAELNTDLPGAMAASKAAGEAEMLYGPFYEVAEDISACRH
jgi:hypothetical protein